MRENKPNIYSYTDFRAYLKAFFEHKKSLNPAYSYRVFSKQVGSVSHTFLWQVVEGKRNLSNKLFEKLAAALKLSKGETEHFISLVRFNQAKNTSEKAVHLRQILKSKKFIQVHRLEANQFEYLSKWYYPAIREMVLLPGFENSPEWISSHLSPKISAAEAAEAIELLIRIKLLRRNRKGKLVQTKRHIHSGGKLASLSTSVIHKQMLNRAVDALEKQHPAEVNFSGVTVAVSTAKLKEAMARIYRFKREMHEFMSNDSDADTVYQVNINLFRLCEVLDNETK